MHLVILIPAFNEAQTIGDVLQSIPKSYSGISKQTILVVDDGSDDETSVIASQAGADEVVHHEWRSGLAEAFRTGKKRAEELGADIVVTLDADGQYDAREIEQLIQPVLQHKADIVIGERPIMNSKHMPVGNKLGNIVGSGMLRILLGIPVQDASSGFRAFSYDALGHMNIRSRHTYTHETLMRAHALRMRIQSVPVSFHARRHGESKLVRTLGNHIARSVGTILRCMLTVDPLRTFIRLGALTGLLGALLFALSFIVNSYTDPWLGAVALLTVFAGFQFCIVGLLSELFRSRL